MSTFQIPRHAYKSTAPQIYHESIISSSSAPLTEAQVYAKILEKYEEVSRHISICRRELNTDGKLWLAELLTWEFFFPTNKSAFPGKRPHFHNRPRELESNGLPFCDCCACMAWEQGDVRCPFIRMGKCERGVHGEFKYRIGSEVAGKVVCRACEEGGEKVVEEKKVGGEKVGYVKKLAGEAKLMDDGWVEVEGIKIGVEKEDGEGWMLVGE